MQHSLKLLGASACLGLLASFSCAATPPATPSTAKPLVWQPLGEPGSGGWNTAIRISPHDPKRMLTGGDMLGTAISTDAGQSWGAATGLKGYEINDFTFDAKNPNLVWVGTLAGPYQSLDGGKTWAEKRDGFPEKLFFGFSAPVERVLIDPNNANHLLTGGGSSRGWDLPGPRPQWGAIWDSRDGGAHWKRLTTIGAGGNVADDKGASIYALSFAPNSAQTVYAAIPGVGFLRSEDGGKTWGVSNTGLPNTQVRRLQVNTKTPNVVWAALSNAKEGDKVTPGGIYKSSDNGKTWTPLLNGLSQLVDENNLSFTARYEGLAVAESDPNFMVTGDTAWNAGDIYISRDGGAHWILVATKQNIGANSNNPARANAQKVETAYPAGLAGNNFAIDPKNPKVIWNIGSEHLLSSVDGGVTWRDGNVKMPDGSWHGRGFSGLCSMNYRFDPFHKGVAVLQSMDAGRAWVTSDGGASWRYNPGLENPSPWGGGKDASFAKDGAVYITTGQYNDFEGLGVSHDDGKTWKIERGKEYGLPDGGSAGGVYTLPDDSSQVWVTIGGQLYYSSDAAAHFQPIKLPGWAGWIGADPRNPQHLFVSGDPDCFESTDGKTFTAIGGPRKAGRMAVDANGLLYVAADEGKRGGLWRYDGSKPEEARWERLFDDSWIMGIAVDPKNPARLALTTSQNPWGENSQATGVYISADAGRTWSRQNEGLAMLRGHVIAFDPFDDQNLVYGSFGRGFYKTVWPLDFKPKGEKSYLSSDADATFAQAGAAAISLVNGNMEAGGAVPDAWTNKWEGRGKLEIARDTTTHSEGAASLHVSTVGDSQGQVTQGVDVDGSVTFTLTGQLKTTGNAKVSVMVQPTDDKYTPIGFIQAEFAMNDRDWAPFKKDIIIPKSARHFNVGLFLDGTGQAWLDDVQILHPKQYTPPIPEAPRLKNGSMTEGEDKPAAWDQNWTGHGQLDIARDTTTFHSAPASLRVQSKGDTQGQWSQMVDAQGSAKFTLKGFVKSAGNVKVNVAVQPFTDNWSPITFMQAGYVQNDSDWTPFSKEIELPDNAARAGILILLEGDGKAWLDDVEIVGADGKTRIARVPDPIPADVPQPTKEQSPLVASPGYYPDYPKAWATFHYNFVQQAKDSLLDSPIKAVFLGDSITQNWNANGKAQWDKNFAPQGAANFGIGGDGVQQVLWRVQNGELDAIKPKVVVLKIGVNNLLGGKNGTDDEIATGIKNLVAEIKKHAPGAKILLLGILPTQRTADNGLRGRVKNINAQIAKLDDGGQSVRFLDIGNAFLDGNGYLSEQISADGVHLTPAGYDIFAAQLLPVFNGLMK